MKEVKQSELRPSERKGWGNAGQGRIRTAGRGGGEAFRMRGGGCGGVRTETSFVPACLPACPPLCFACVVGSLEPSRGRSQDTTGGEAKGVLSGSVPVIVLQTWGKS